MKIKNREFNGILKLTAFGKIHKDEVNDKKREYK